MANNTARNVNQVNDKNNSRAKQSLILYSQLSNVKKQKQAHQNGRIFLVLLTF